MNNKNKAANPGLLVMALLLVLLALVVVLVAVILATGIGSKNDNKDPIEYNTTTTGNTLSDPTSTPDTTTTVDPDVTTTQDTPSSSTNTPNTGSGTITGTNVQPPVTTPNTGNQTQTPGKNTVQVSSSSVNKGALILVNNDHLVSYRTQFPARSELIGNTELQKELGLVRVKGTGDYKMPHSNHFLNENAANYFYDMMEEFVKQNGSQDVFLRNAYYCDYSEEIPHANIHATGYAVDLQLMTDDGQFSLKSNSEFYQWFIDNCYKYGYIFVGDTQNSNTSSGYSTFRFVGTAHAGCMKVYSMNFEEYLSYITNRTPDSCIRYTDAYDVEWMIYYVKASAGDTTDVTVFGDETCYEISGDNQGGFIVTVNASKLG